MTSIISDYRVIKSAIGNLIEASGYRNDFLAKKIGISSPNFSVKKLKNTWNEDELEKLLAVLTGPNEEVQDLLMLELMRSRKNEPDMSYDDYKKEIASWK